MHGRVFGNSEIIAKEIGGQFRPGKDEIVLSVVGAVCKAIWKDKTDFAIAEICSCDPRNARRYMSGELPPPPKLLIAVQIAMTYGVKEKVR